MALSKLPLPRQWRYQLLDWFGGKLRHEQRPHVDQALYGETIAATVRRLRLHRDTAPADLRTDIYLPLNG